MLEVGPGLGSLTRYLAQAARRVVAVELDTHLIPILEEVLAGYPNVEIVQGDILELDPARLMGEDGYLVVANIPYYITSAVIRHLLEARVETRAPGADRAARGGRAHLRRAGRHEPAGAERAGVRQAARGGAHPGGGFYPAAQGRFEPWCASTCIPSRASRAEHLDEFFRLAKAGFSQKRKTLRNSLSGGLGWPPARGRRAAAIRGHRPAAPGRDPHPRRMEGARSLTWNERIVAQKKDRMLASDSVFGSIVI